MQTLPSQRPSDLHFRFKVLDLDYLGEDLGQQEVKGRDGEGGDIVIEDLCDHPSRDVLIRRGELARGRNHVIQ